MNIFLPKSFCRVLGNFTLINHLISPRTSTLRVKNNNGLYHLKSLPLQNILFPVTCSSYYYSTVRKSENKNTDNSEPHKVESIPCEAPVSKVNQKGRLKQAVRDYGATIVVFHVVISLASLGLCYLAISNGVDAVRLLTFIGFSESVVSSKVAIGGSTFVISYAVHKMFAPIRIGITLSVAPFIVRYLRRVNWIKTPKK